MIFLPVKVFPEIVLLALVEFVFLNFANVLISPDQNDYDIPNTRLASALMHMSSASPGGSTAG